MISRLPKWIWAGAAILAFCAGMINVIAILGFAHKAATHVTGICSLLSIAAFDGDRTMVRETLFILFSFFIGAALSGFIVRDGQLRMGRRYGFALTVESVLLFASTYGFVRGAAYGEYLASMAAGLQNAMVSTYSGAIVRTTHLTGILTDIGALVGHRIRGGKTDHRRFRLLSVIFLSFLAGGFFAGHAYHRWGAAAMLFPAGMIGVSAIVYEAARRAAKKSAGGGELKPVTFFTG